MNMDMITAREYRAKFAVKAKARSVRRERGTMNKTEARYAHHLNGRVQVKDVLDWRFEPIKLRLADNTYLTMDFAVILWDGTIELHDVKAYWKKAGKVAIEDDAAVKVKVAAELYPWFTFRTVWEQDGRWMNKEH
jgi:hypothetical protein